MVSKHVGKISDYLLATFILSRYGNAYDLDIIPSNQVQPDNDTGLG